MPRYQRLEEGMLPGGLKKPSAYLPLLETSLASPTSTSPAEMESTVAEYAGTRRAWKRYIRRMKARGMADEESAGIVV